MLEHELLLNCAKTKPDSARLSEILANRLDWDYVLKQGNLHNIGPLLYNGLKSFSVPVHRTLEMVYAYTGFHNALFLDELKRIGEELGRRDIRFITLKGPALARDVYGDIALRPFADIDILVRKSDLHKATALLETLGYSYRHSQFYERYHFHLPFVKKGKTSFLLELHWAFADRFILNRVDMDKVWDDTDSNTLPPEINTLYLLLHIEKHAFLNKIVYEEKNPGDWIFTNPRGNLLIWYSDLYELISNHKTNLNKVKALAEEWALRDILHHNLYILSKLYPLQALENILSGMPRHKMPALKKIFYMPALSETNYPRLCRGKESEPACQKSQASGLRNQRGPRAFTLNRAMQLRPIRILDLVDYLFPSRAKMAAYYRVSSRGMVMLYYVVHIISGLREIIGEFSGILHHLVISSRLAGIRSAPTKQT